jgi:thioredoxin-like negative regulator of GroEL
MADKMKRGDPMLILFHADWCPHCVEYVGHPRTASYPWQQVCSHIDDRFNGEVGLCEVEAGKMSYLPSGIPPVQGFPTLMYYQGGSFEEFNGDRRDKEAIQQFIQKKLKSGGAQPAKPAKKAAKPVVKQAKPAVKKPAAKK